MLTDERKEEIRDKIEWEGFDYYFNGYCGPESHKDIPELYKLHKAFVEAYENLENWLRENDMLY